MAKKHSGRPKEVSLDEMLEQGDPSRSRSVNPQNDPGLRDGNSGRGDVDWDAEDEVTTDNDVGDTLDTGEPIAGTSGGAVGGTPAGGRTVEHVTHGLSSPGSKRGDSTIGSKPNRD
ncbi:MAG TPA: hypothetical protein VH120_00495 [Gemmataceae bacterium]|nr:hypothetical protein [Gemmataceae bacterium]